MIIVLYTLFVVDRMASRDKEGRPLMAYEGRKAKADRDAQYKLSWTADTLPHPEPVSMNAHYFLRN